MQTFVAVTGVANIVAFLALATLALRHWQRRRDSAAGWAALAFSTLGLVVVSRGILPDHPHGFVENASVRLVVVLLVLFPVLLFGFTTSFDRASPLLRRFISTMTTALIVWTLALPQFAHAGEAQPWWFTAYVIGFLVHWTVLTVVVAFRLWRAGRGEPGVARRRMQLLAFAAATITVAIFAFATNRDPHSTAAAVASTFALISALAFLLGLAPPPALRASWRRHEQQHAQTAIQELVTQAMKPEEIVDRVLRPMVDIVGARAIELRDDDGNLIGSYNLPPEASGRMSSGVVRVSSAGLSMTIWTSPYAPFFGGDELRILETLAALTGIALERVRLFSREYEARQALERANELQANFVALAAHELRTPVTTIHGFVRTLNTYADRLSEDRSAVIRTSLEEQTTRMARLVEQLLDLSRLDAEATEINPQPLAIRERVDEVVAAAAAGSPEDVVIEIPRDVEAVADPEAFDRILSNLLTNALRYGAPPVTIRAERTDSHLRVSVEDCGPGVPADFVPDLFERFARAGVTNDRTPGTGLGLAIARSYARTNGGDLLYEQANPHGARFLFVLPTVEGGR